MTNIYLNQRLTDRERRAQIFEGAILVYSGLSACKTLCASALQTVRDVFETPTPEVTISHQPIEIFVKKAETAKKTFTNSLRSKELIRDYVIEMGSDPADYYFDVPRLRIVPHYDYLHAGVSYAYAAHRDTWYGGPPYQINHWMPVLPITPDQTMAIYPEYFRRPLKNSSEEFDLSYWIGSERAKAAQNVQREERRHPLPLEKIDLTGELRFAGNTGDIIVFSGSNLHATIPNRTAVTRFSVDFRLFHVDDINGHSGLTAPENIDSRAVSEDFGMPSCFSAADFSPFQRKN
ncbi:MAG: hypothetical protein ACLPV8_15285 [Steroidobacteraceae bacterium]